MILLGMTTFAVASCSKSDSSPSVSEEDAADVVGTYVSSDFSSSTSDAAGISTDTGNKANRVMYGGRSESSPCGVTYDSTLSRSGMIGTIINYSYQLSYGYTLTCSGAIPSSLGVDLSSTGTYSGPRVSSTGSGAGTWTITGFGSPTVYSLNGSYTKTETITQKTGAQKNFTCNLVLTSSNVTVDKSTKKLTGGTISYVMTGAITGGSSFSFAGTITFLGDESASITVGSSTYTVSLSAGTITKS
ncbi:MAG: hypothetical protein QM734_04020 [Cyclobacteriaceae bacterium]